MRHLRNLLSSGLPIVGMILVFLALLIPPISSNIRVQIGVVLFGLLIIEAGVWHLTDKILPDEREFTALRAEVDNFIERVRVLNTQGGDLKAQGAGTDAEPFEKTVREMHEAVDRMAKVAGKKG